MDSASSEYAVVTGDIVASSRLAPEALQSILHVLRDGCERFAAVFPGTVVGALDVYSGDGWQVLLAGRRLSLRAMLFLRTVVKSIDTPRVDTRAALAWGPVDEATVNPERISESTGEAFTRSGRALRELKKNRFFGWHAGAPPGGERWAAVLAAAAGLLDELAFHWTARQAQALALALLGHSQVEIADTLDKSQPTIHQALQSTGWNGIADFLDAIENSFDSN